MDIPRRLSIILLAALAAVLQLQAQRPTESYQGRSVIAQQVMVRLKIPSTAAVQAIQAILHADSVRQVGGPAGPYVIHSSNLNVPSLLAILSGRSDLFYAEPDYLIHSTAVPNDPSFPQLWGLQNTGTGADIRAVPAWDISTGSTANVVGVVDTGIDYMHPDLVGNVWSAPTAFTITVNNNSPITCPAGSHGYNAILHTCDPKDDNGHGTHTSGTIGAVGNNSTGVSGVNWRTQIMGLKFLDSTGSGSTSDAVDAIEFAIQTKLFFAATGTPVNVRVLSNSWGGGGFSQSLLNEITKAGTSDMLFVAAAGNSASNLDTTPFYPASYNAANLVAVAATDSTDALASFSNFGQNSVHLGAPGVSILSTLPNNSYGYLSGTSMATPHVAGAAMLVLSKCALNTAGVRSTIFSNVDSIPSLQAITVTGGRLNVNKAIRSCAAGSTSGSAAFVKTDSTTSGSWKGVYGGNGSYIVNDSSNLPSYVALTPSGNNAWTWAASTSDPRALQKGASTTDRIASCWFSFSSFSIDLAFNDTNTHQVALYSLDWDSLGRTQRVDILDASNNVLDSRSLSGYAGGQYLVWNLSGHVIMRITNTNPSWNAVIGGLFFGTSGTTAPSGTATFLKTDSTTSGTWKGAYGADGSIVVNDSSSLPSYVAITPSGNNAWTWAASTSDPRALQKGASTTDRIASCWFSFSSFSIDLAFNDTNTHQVALYSLDWDSLGRTQRVDILDASNNVLDSRSLSGYAGGQYLVWNLSGHVIMRITNTNPSWNAVIGGLFFGTSGTTAPPGTATFLKTDSTTSGTWKGAYGADGSIVVNDSSSLPSYVAITPSGNSAWTWAASTTDPRALQKGASTTDRIASCWFSASSFTIDLAFKDTNTHQVELYSLDWDSLGRTQRVDILDPSNNVLDTRSLSGYAGGQYLVWNLSGHVIMRITNTNPTLNAVIGGLFFR